MSDKVIIQDLEVRTTLGYDSWERRKPQNIFISVAIRTSVRMAGHSDKVVDSVHYGHARKQIEKFVDEHPKLRSMEAMAEGIARTCLELTNKALAVQVDLRKPRTLLQAEAACVVIYRTRQDVLGTCTWPELISSQEDVDEERQIQIKEYEKSIVATTAVFHDTVDLLHYDALIIKGLRFKVILGVNLWERHYQQNISVDLTIHAPRHLPHSTPHQLVNSVPRSHTFRSLVEAVTELVESSDFKTVEALSTAITRVAVKQCQIEKITVRVAKPSALMFAACSAVEITRETKDFLPASQDIRIDEVDENQACDRRTVYVALGTNVGDRLGHLHKALGELNRLPNTRVTQTGFLYETAPMYLVDQPAFLNAACEIQTTLEPLPLLDALKHIEANMGRDFTTVRNGPRVIDLDILFYDQVELETERLTIPHPRLHERRFQLAPLCDMNARLFHPRYGKTMGALLRRLTTHTNAPNDVVRVTPLAMAQERQLVKDLTPNGQKETLIMGIINCTPDSFSDGGECLQLEAAIERSLTLVNQGAHILDIGGQSTRPHATLVGAQEEMARILPLIKALRFRGMTVPISVDTFHASVARAALDAGADIINDVTGGTYDNDMMATVASYACPIIMMHMRGNPSTMTQLNDYSAYGHDVLRGIRHELSELVAKAYSQGIPRWNIILDPGFGFAKEEEQNFECLKRLKEITMKQIPPNKRIGLDEELMTDLVGFPLLVGSSRKRFIGSVIGKSKAKDRVWGTAATVTAAIQAKAAIVRVHDVDEMVDVVKVADHIWRDVCLHHEEVL